MLWRWVRAGAVLAVLGLVAACGGAAGASSGSAPATVVLAVRPADGAAGVPARGAVLVTATHGRLTQVTLTDDRDEPVAGSIAADGRSWRPTTDLAPRTRYHLDALAVDASGLQASRHADFSTFTPMRTLTASWSPEAGGTVGVGMVVSVRFDRPVTDRAAVQRAITVTADPATPVAGHWFGDQRLDLRPEHYWAPGTRAVLHVRLAGVEGTRDVWGTQDEDVPFRVGRSQISTADTAAGTLTVVRDGTALRVLPLADASPAAGPLVVSQLLGSAPAGLVTGASAAVPYALRLTDSGGFVHGGDASCPAGAAGCVLLSGTAAAWFYDHSVLGDVVRVAGPSGAADGVRPDDGLNGWGMSWASWLAGSALPD